MMTAYHAKYYAHELSARSAAQGVERLSQSLFDAKIDLNPHQIEAALFALKNPLSKGVIMADEVGLGKTIEAGLVLCQHWAERKRRLLIICPAALRKQWAEELQDKFNLPSQVLDSKTWQQASANGKTNPLDQAKISIISYHYAQRMEEALLSIAWDLVVIDEAHKLRNAHQKSSKIGQALRRALYGRKKLLLTATPLQNSLLELYGLSTLIDEELFGDEKAFRKQYITGSKLPELRQRLKTFAQRTLRKDVLEYIRYTQRKTLTVPFEPSDSEHQLYQQVSTFLEREESYALPKAQRHLTGLILRKLLASSTRAVLNTLERIRERLGKLQAQSAPLQTELPLEDLIEEDDLGSDYAEAARSKGLDEDANTDEQIDQELLAAEIAELDTLIEHARSIANDSKAGALLTALEQGFAQMQAMDAPRKAIVFTESKRTQDYLLAYLAQHGYGAKIVAFSGTNDSKEATLIYREWLAQHRDTDKVTGSGDVDRRSALIDYFRNQAEIMIATEAAAEGVNLQFCSLLINYDLPWNPQRVEQRIGRCHRYGQQFDVVVINFLNQRNEADKRVLELLTEKFQLFNGVFGASDEILGKIEAGIDFEKRILEIYNTCRTPEQIQTGFAQLQKELEAAINERMSQTQAQLLEHFDEDIHELLKLQLDQARQRLDKLGRWFWWLSQYALRPYAHFTEAEYYFHLRVAPAPHLPLGFYQLSKQTLKTDLQSIEQPVYTHRLSHPLGEWVVERGLQAETPFAELTFHYASHDTKISVVEQLRGHSGWLSLSKLTIDSLQTDEHLVFSAFTDEGHSIEDETCRKLFTVAATSKAISSTAPTALAQMQQRRVDAQLSKCMEANQHYFREERDKLERWADDKILASEEALEETKAKIKTFKRESRQADSLEQQQVLQKQLRDLESQQRRQRQAIFAVEDEVIARRDALVNALEQRLKQHITIESLFTIRWSVVGQATTHQVVKAIPYQITSLADLTGKSAQNDRPLPQLWVKILADVFPQLETRFELPDNHEPNFMHMMIPKTTLVLRVKPLVWESIKAVANLWLLLSLIKSGNTTESVLAGVGIGEAMKSLLQTVVKLEENKGEVCTYNALLHSTDRVRTGIGIFPEQADVIRAHYQLRQHCPMTSCCFHQQGCQLKDDQLQAIIEALVEKKVFEQHDGDKLWVTL